MTDAGPDAAAACAACGEVTVPGASFCEACGADIGPVGSQPPACVACEAAGTEILDGYCMVCGHKQPDPRDHITIDLGWLAGVTDRGRRHHHNEDALAIADVDGTAVLVVCDGVSSTADSQIASQAAADAGLRVLERGLRRGGAAADLLAEAVEAAQVAAVVSRDGTETDASSTLVAVVATPVGAGVDIHVAWLGDSRAYWIASESQLLTLDHNWANELVAAGTLAPEEAWEHPHAHTLTRWIGRDAAGLDPGLMSLTVPAPGAVLACTDGLWNHAATAPEMHALDAWDAASAIDVAGRLVDFANGSGGHDNITAAVAFFEAPGDVVDSPGAAQGAEDG